MISDLISKKYENLHHSTRNFTMISILKSKNIFANVFKRKSRFEKFTFADPKKWIESGVKFWFEIYPLATFKNHTKMRWRKISKFSFCRSILTTLKHCYKILKCSCSLFFTNQVWDRPLYSLSIYEYISLINGISDLGKIFTLLQCKNT